VNQPPLKPLHPETSLSPAKLAAFEKLPTDALKQSLVPGQAHCLKTRPDGTMLDGNHRVHVLGGRGEDVNALPREVVERERERLQADYEARRARQQSHDRDWGRER
jgi:hypothetical protein